MLNTYKKARLVAGISQIELAKRLGITAGAVSQWECGRCKPSCKKLKALAEILNTTVDDLIEPSQEGA